jgi:peroxiredoxin
MISQRLARLSIVLYAMIALCSSCKTKGPLISMDEDGGNSAIPHGILEENAALKPRTSPIGLGDAVPAFTLPDQQGRLVSAAELAGTKGAVIVITPRDESPAARPAYDWARKNKNLLESRGIEVLLITPQSPDDNAKVAAREELRIAILGDAQSWVARSFGAARDNAGAQAAHAFVLGADGRIHMAERTMPDAALAIMAAETLPGKRERSFFLP